MRTFWLLLVAVAILSGCGAHYAKQAPVNSNYDYKGLWFSMICPDGQIGIQMTFPDYKTTYMATYLCY